MAKPYEIRVTRQAQKDLATLTPNLKRKLKEILTETLARNPWCGKRLLGDLAGSFSLRLTYKDRIVYSVDEEKHIIYVERARTHYGE